MLEYDFEASLGYWICVSGHLFQRAMNERLEPQGITFRQCQVLGRLACDGELSQVELAELMNIEPPTLVTVLDRMERDGLIERVACDDDRRRKLIRPLPRSKPVWKKIVACAQQVRTEASQGLSAADLAELKRLLGVVRANLERPPRAKGPRRAARKLIPEKAMR